MPATTAASYRSKCPTCGGWIEEGDEIALDEEEAVWVHLACHPEHE